MENDKLSKAKQKIIDEYISEYIDLQLDHYNAIKKINASAKESLERTKKIEKINESISKLTRKYFSNADKVIENNEQIDNEKVDLLIDEYEKFIHNQLNSIDKNSVDIQFLEIETAKFIAKFNNNFKS